MKDLIHFSLVFCPLEIPQSTAPGILVTAVALKSDESSHQDFQEYVLYTSTMTQKPLHFLLFPTSNLSNSRDSVNFHDKVI